MKDNVPKNQKKNSKSALKKNTLKDSNIEKDKRYKDNLLKQSSQRAFYHKTG